MSSQPYGKFSGMTTTRDNVAPTTAVTDGAGKAFSKQTAANQVGDQAAEGDIFRLITNQSSSTTIYLGETAALANSAGAYPLGPGKDFVLLGPSGIGWKGDLYVKGDDVATYATMKF